MADYPTIEDCIGETPLVRLQRIPGNTSNTILAKLEGNNPAGSVKDRPAMSMIQRAERRGDIKPGDTLIEATSGNTGIALAMAAAIKGYRMVLIMPSHMSEERKAAMAAYGAELVMVTQEEGMEGARDLTSSPIRTTRLHTTRELRLRYIVRLMEKSPTLSAPWVQPEPSWDAPGISRK
jgi:cysteine synthase B